MARFSWLLLMRLIVVSIYFIYFLLYCVLTNWVSPCYTSRLTVLCCVLTNWDLPSYTWWLTGCWKQLWPKIGRQQMYANNTGIMTGLHLEWTGLWEHPPPATPCFSLLCCDVTWNAIFCCYCEEKHGIIMLPFSYIALWSFSRFVLTQHGGHWWLCPLTWFVRWFF